MAPSVSNLNVSGVPDVYLAAADENVSMGPLNWSIWGTPRQLLLRRGAVLGPIRAYKRAIPDDSIAAPDQAG